jgi:PAS domain S-box-containing protein
VRDETGAVIALVGVSEDITGRKRTEDALRQSQRLLQTVFDAVPYRMVLKDRHRRFLLVNRAAAEMFGVPPGECVGRKTSESSYFTPETARMIDEADDRVLEQGFPVEIPEEPFMTRDGRAGVSRVIKLPVRDETGAVVALVGVSEDITERKRTEDALRQSQRLLQTVFDAVPHSLYIKDRDRPFQLINRAGAGLYGLQPSDVIGRTSHDFSYATPETLHRIDEADTRVLEQGLPVEIPEQPFVTPDGRTGVGRVIKVPVRDETGAVVALVGVSEDITERKRTEDALRQSQRLLQTVFDAVPHRMYIKDRDRRFQMINRAGAELYGMQPSEVIGRTTREISYSSPETLRVIDEADTGVLAQGLPVEVPEILFVTPDGSLGVHRFIKLPVKDETGAVIALVGVSEDITGRKRAEETVRRSEAQLKTAQRIAKLGAWNWDIASDKVAWSDELYAIFGQDRASFVPTRETYMTRVEPEDRERLRATLLRTLASKTETRTEDEFRIRRPDGEVRTVRSVREIERAADGTPVRIVGAVQDITDYKRADASLKESEARFRMLFDQATEGIFILDSKGTYLDANASGCRMLGYSRDELLRLNLANVVAPGGKELALPSLGTIVCGETLVRERTLIRQDGTFLSVEVTATARPDGLMQALVRDITDRKRAEEALRKSEQRLAEAQRIARMGAWEQDLKTQELWWSDEQYRLFGLPPDGARVDFSVFMARVHPEDRAAIRKAREVAIATGNFEHEYRMVLPDGTARSIHTVIKATYDRDGAPVSLAGTSQDVTGHKRAEAERLELQDQLQRARRMETVGTLAGGVAHDFNNLLAPILGFAELLQSDLAGEPERAALVKPILEAALRGRDLTQRILLFSRKTTAPREPIQLAPILAEVLALLRATLPGSVAIRPCIAERMHAVEADSARVHSAVMNLCVNAAQAMPAGGILGVRLDEVELSGQPTYLGTRLTGRFARIEISDTGVGIAEAVMSHVFEPFFTTRDVGKGTGLGLSSVLGIVQEHGGAVDVHSRMGEGSTFTIYLPLAAASAAPSEHPDAAPIGGTESILCVDDEPGVLAVLNGMLERLGYRVSAYQQADAALAALRAEPHRFDLVISDFSMPEMPGDRMARHIHELRADLPVLVCTGNDERLPDEANRTPAIADLLLKPVALAQLARAVRRILDRRTLPAPLEAFPEERPGK